MRRRFFIDREDASRVDELIARRYLKLGRNSITSAHLMGGCRMGAAPADSVTDAWGRVHGVPWLSVADASLFPRAAEINPYVTVMALADRVAERSARPPGSCSRQHEDAAASALVVSALEDEGVRFTFGIPGTHNIELYDALDRSVLVTPGPGHRRAGRRRSWPTACRARRAASASSTWCRARA